MREIRWLVFQLIWLLVALLVLYLLVIFVPVFQTPALRTTADGRCDAVSNLGITYFSLNFGMMFTMTLLSTEDGFAPG